MWGAALMALLAADISPLMTPFMKAAVIPT